MVRLAAGSTVYCMVIYSSAASGCTRTCSDAAAAAGDDDDDDDDDVITLLITVMMVLYEAAVSGALSLAVNHHSSQSSPPSLPSASPCLSVSWFIHNAVQSHAPRSTTLLLLTSLGIVSDSWRGTVSRGVCLFVGVSVT